MDRQGPKKTLTSFIELKNILLKESSSKLVEQANLNDSSNDLIFKVKKIIQDIKIASSSSDLFICLCKLSSFVESIENERLNQLIKNTNLYISLISAIFNNKIFCETLNMLVKEEKDIMGKDAEFMHVPEKQCINTSISLAFFPLALMLPFLKYESIEFFRSHITKLLKLTLRGINDHEISFTNLCFKLESISWNYGYHYKEKFSINLSEKFLFDNLKMARSLAGISLLSLAVNTSLAGQFKVSFRRSEDEEYFNLSRALNNIYGAVYRIEAGIQSYYDNVPKEKNNCIKEFFNLFVWSNEKNLLYFIKEVSAGFEYRDERRFREVILAKISEAEEIKNNLKKFAQQHLSAFSSELEGGEREWANKVYIVSIKAMAALAEVDSATDHRWKSSVAIRELKQWIHEVHDILNLFHLEDEFDSIAPFLREENVRIEWKSTFFTPVEEGYINEKAELATGKKIFMLIVKSILGMLNTSGGVIIVGLVEHPDRVVREEILTAIYEKNGRSFFDVGHELEKVGKNLDQIRLQILDNLKSISKVSEEKFNGLFSLDPVLIRTYHKTITVIKISVQKNDKPILNVKEEQGTIWTSLTKRAEGKTIDVDIRDYLAFQ